MKYLGILALPVRRVWAWACRRPRLAAVLISLITVYMLGWACAPAANAASGGDPSPDAPADHLITSAGIRASHYSALFINRGDFFSGDKGIWAWFLDMMWGVYFWGVTSAIDTFTWLLQFKWVDVIAVPMRGLSIAISHLLGYFGLAPFGLFLTGCLAASLLLRGKFGKAFVEVAVTAVIFAALGGFLANPVLWLTEPGGPLQSAREGGAQLSAAIIKGDGDIHAVSSEENPVGDAVIGPLLDIFLVIPAESVSFGHLIEGNCSKVLDTAVKNLDPIKRDTNPIRDAVGTCDTDAKTYADNTGIFQLMSVLAMEVGSLWLFLFAWAIALLLIGSILGTLFMGLTTTWRAVFALFPWANRAKLFFSIAAMFAGLFFIITAQVALAAWLWLLTTAMPLISKLNVPIGMQLNVMSYIGTAAVISLAIFLYHHHRAAKRLAERLNSALENAGGVRRDAMPLMTLPTGVKRIAQQYIGNKLSNKEMEDELGTWGDSFGDDNRMVNIFNFGQGPITGPPSSVNGGEYTATRFGDPAPRPTSEGTGHDAADFADTGASAVGTAVRYAGALKAGLPGVALEAGKDVASSASRRRVTVDGKGNGHVGQGSSTTPKVVGQGSTVAPSTAPRVVPAAGGPEHTSARRISIGNDGVGSVVHETTTLKQPTVPAAVGSDAIERVRPRALRG